MNDNASLITGISGKELRQGKRTISVPFQVALADCQEALYCEDIVRIIPEKRIVAFGRWGNTPVVAKLFYDGGKAKKQADRDAAGVAILTAAKIPTPEMIFQGVTTDGKIHVLIFQRIFDAQTLNAASEKKDFEKFFQVLRAITIELATQHVLGIVQKDLHLNNFLITDKTIYTLDGANITQFNGILPKKQSLENLALFFSQLGVGKEKIQEKLFLCYAQARGWIFKQADIDKLQIIVQKNITERWQRYQKKIFRNSSTFSRIQSSSAFIIYDNHYTSDAFVAVLKNPDAVFQEKNTQILKAGNTSTVAKIKIHHRYFVIKRYNIKNSWHAVRRCLRSTRAAKSWELAQQMQLLGIATAKPIAFIENRFLGLRGKSYFIMEWVEGLHAGEYFTQYPSEMVAKRIIALLINLAKLHLTHGDLKVTNILIENHYPVLIDLDGMIKHETLFGLKHAFYKELKRLMQNWENQPSVRLLFEKLTQ